MTDDLTKARIARAQRDDREAAGELLQEVLPRVRNLVRYLIRGDQDVDDIAQQCLISILRGLVQYRGDGSFYSWVDRVVARQTFSEIRKNRKRQLVEIQTEVEGVTTMDEFMQRRELARMLDQIPDEQRHAVVLHHCVGMSVPEIATTLDIPFDTAKSRLRLGMKKLRAPKNVEVPS